MTRFTQIINRDENLIKSDHAEERMNQRGMRFNSAKTIFKEGCVFESLKTKGRLEVFFSRKDKDRLENKIKEEIRELRNIQKKKLCGKVICDAAYEMSRKDISDKISEKKVELRQISKLSNKLVVTENDRLITCYHKNKNNYLKNQRRRWKF